MHPKIGFLFNHEQIHQIAHGAPVAFALSRLRPDCEVTIIASSDAQMREVERYAEGFPGHRCRLQRLDLPWFSRLVSRAFRFVAPVERLAILRHHARWFEQFDALVTPEKTSLMLRSRFGVTGPKFIHTRHGAGDREIGFDEHSGQFDLVLFSGRKIADRLAALDRMPAAHAIVGYPKFDAVDALVRPPAPLFDNQRKTVLYAPHPSPYLSSWYRCGRDILEFFHQSAAYNLIFAPHVMLFQRQWNISLDRLDIARPGRIARKYRECGHIHIDLGSPASTDMTYSEAADIYLGDVSSQIYEFLRRPRPCLFVDPFGRDWQNDPNYLQWRAGPVIHDAANLGAALRDAEASHDQYRAAQAEIFGYSCDITEQPSSERAALAIAAFLDKKAAAS